MIVALVAAHRLGATPETVAALKSIPAIDSVVVVADGSQAVREWCRSHSVDCVWLTNNRGKGAAMAAGVAATPEADQYVLCDADLKGTAAELAPLIDAVIAGADMAIAVFPPAGNRAGAGRIKALSRSMVQRWTGLELAEPLSGQRCVDGAWLRGHVAAPRFGYEVGMDLAAGEDGLVVREIPLPLDHDHTGRGVAGMTHRLAQGVDIVRTMASWAWVNRGGLRIAGLVGIVALLALGGMLGKDRPLAHPAAGTEKPIVLVLGPVSALDELESGGDPAALLIARTPSFPSDLPSLFGSISAGNPAVITAPEHVGDTFENAGLAWGPPPVEPVRVARNDTRFVVDGVTREDTQSVGVIGSLGAALQEHGWRRVASGWGTSPASGLVLADHHGGVDAVQWDQSLPLEDREIVAHYVEGDTLQAARSIQAAHPEARVLTIGIPTGDIWQLGLFDAANGAAIGSPQRAGYVTLYDLAPTVLQTAGIDLGDLAFRGVPIEWGTGLARESEGLLDAVRRTQERERTYATVMIGWVAFQVLCVGAIGVASRLARDRAPNIARWSAALSLGFVPAAMMYRVLPWWFQQGGRQVIGYVTLSILIAILAQRFHRFSLSPVVAIAGLTYALCVVNALSGGAIDWLSLFGYTPLTGARFYGVGNMGFCLLLMSSLIVGTALRTALGSSTTALLTACLVVVIACVVQVLPHFGADFGSVLAFVPLIIGLVFTKWSYRAIRLRRIAIAIPTALVTTAVVARLVIAISPDTHVGSIGSSGGVFALIRAKLATSQRVLLISPVGVAVVLVALGILAIIMLRPNWFGRFDTWRAGVWWMCIATLIGGAVNDSGVVIVGIGVAFCHVMVGLLGPGQSLIEKREAP